MKSNDIQFWARYALLIIILIAITVAVLVLYRDDENRPVADGKSRDPATNMSRVYSTHRLSSVEPFKKQLGDFVLEIKPDEKNLTERLQKMESLKKPVSDKWVGDFKSRHFKAGSTLREAITRYAQQEGMQVIWELEQDFIIKHNFTIKNSIVGAMYDIAKTISANFNSPVLSYFCPKQRTLVITDHINQYLSDNCTLVDQ